MTSGKANVPSEAEKRSERAGSLAISVRRLRRVGRGPCCRGRHPSADSPGGAASTAPSPGVGNRQESDQHTEAERTSFRALRRCRSKFHYAKLPFCIIKHQVRWQFKRIRRPMLTPYACRSVRRKLIKNPAAASETISGRVGR